jgi:hypothetical protein
MAVTLPVIVLVYDLIFVTHVSEFLVWRKIRPHIPYWVILGGYFVLRFFMFSGLGGYKTKLFGTFIFSNLVTYFKFFTIPFTDHIFSPALTVNLVGLAIIVLICLIISNTTRFAMLWIFITLLPVSAFTLGRGAYLASAGFCMLLALFLTFNIPATLQVFRKKTFQIGLRGIQVLLIMMIFYQYTLALTTSNAWWSGVADINEQVPLMVKTIHPTFPQRAKICLQNVPLVPNQRFNGAFLLRYPENDIGGIYTHDFEKCVKKLEQNELDTMYFFHYDQEEKILYDVTYQQQEKYREHKPLENRRIVRQLSSQKPQLHLTFDTLQPINSLGIVTSLANSIEIPQGQIIAHGRIEGDNNRVEAFEIVAGQDTAEWAIRFPGIREQIQHEIPQVYEAWTVRHAEKTFTVAQNYIKITHLKNPFILKKFSLELLTYPENQTNLILDVNRILLFDAERDQG